MSEILFIDAAAAIAHQTFIIFRTLFLGCTADNFNVITDAFRVYRIRYLLLEECSLWRLLHSDKILISNTTLRDEIKRKEENYASVFIISGKRKRTAEERRKNCYIPIFRHEIMEDNESRHLEC